MGNFKNVIWGLEHPAMTYRGFKADYKLGNYLLSLKAIKKDCHLLKTGAPLSSAMANRLGNFLTEYAGVPLTKTINSHEIQEKISRFCLDNLRKILFSSEESSPMDRLAQIESSLAYIKILQPELEPPKNLSRLLMLNEYNHWLLKNPEENDLSLWKGVWNKLYPNLPSGKPMVAMFASTGGRKDMEEFILKNRSLFRGYANFVKN